MLEGRRIIFRAPMVVDLEPFEIDESRLGPTEALVRTHVTLISPGTELAWLRGRLGMQTDRPPTFPATRIGYANIGTVLAAGEQVLAKPGDRVYTMGNHASIALVNAAERFCVPVPDGLADERAVFARLAVVSMTTLRTTEARGGDQVAVVGLGLVGNLAAQVFQICGCQVNAFELSPARRAIAERCGLRSVHAPDRMESFAQRHRLVIEATGSARALASAMGLARRGGEVVMVGAPWGGDENSVPSSRLTRPIFARFLRLRSGSEWEVPRQPTPYSADSIQANVATALEWLAEGRLVVDPLITHRLPPAEARSAYEALLSRQDEYLGVLLQWQ